MKRFFGFVLAVYALFGIRNASLQTTAARTERLAEAVVSDSPTPLVTEIATLTPTPTATPTPSPTPTPIPTPSPTPGPYLTPNPEITNRVSDYAKEMGVTEADLELAARVAYLEARGRGEEAYRAVLCVIYNRCLAPRFGGGVTSIETEVYRKSQFSVVHHKRFETLTPPEEIVFMARSVFLYGELSLPEDILFFCASRLGKDWGGRKFYRNIGGNLFFHGSVD